MQLGGGLGESAANIALERSEIAGERDKNCTKNRMCKRAFTQLAFPMSLLVAYS